MSKLLNEIRQNQWDPQNAAQQRLCIEAVADMIRLAEIETTLKELKAAVAGGTR